MGIGEESITEWIRTVGTKDPIHTLGHLTTGQSKVQNRRRAMKDQGACSSAWFDRDVN